MTFFICTLNASKATFIHFLFDCWIACSFCRKSLQTDVKFLDGSVFNKNLAIANRSRVSCAHNKPRASMITPWPRLTVTQDHWKRNHWVTVRRVSGRWILSWPWNVGHRSLKIIEISAIRMLGCGFLFAFHSNYGRICSRLWDIQCQRMAWPWKPGRSRSLKMAPFDRPIPCDFLLVGHCKYSSILCRFRVIWRWIISWPWNRG